MLLAQVQPVLEVVTSVVANEGQHSHRVAANHADSALSSRGGLGGEGNCAEHALLPALGLRNQGDGGLAATTQNDSAQRHTLGVVVLGSEHVDLGCGGAEAGVRVSCRAAGLGGPVLTGPVNQVCGSLVGLALPPDGAVVGQCNVGEDGVALGDSLHSVRIGGVTGARCHAEQASLGVDHACLVVLVELDPCDVVADHLSLPAVNGGLHHCEVGLATCGGERCGNVANLALGVGDLQDEHVLCHPALVATDNGCDTQCVALLTEQCVTAVTGAEGPDFAGLGELDDVLLGIARPGNIFLTGLQGCTNTVQSLDEEAVGLVQLGKNVLTDGCHDAHGADNVCGVAELNSNLGVLSLQGAHDEGNNVHGAAAHGALEQAGQGLLHFDGVAPVVGRACAFFSLGADEGALLDACNVVGIGESCVRVREFVIAEANKGTGVNQFLCQAVVFFLGAIDPVDVCGLGQGRNFANPIQKALVGSGCTLQLLFELSRESTS